MANQTPKRYACIGDVHSQGRTFAAALAYCKERGLTPIILGDLFDSRCTTSESSYVWNLARHAQNEMDAIILNSNHQTRLVDAINFDIEEADYCWETFRTVNELTEEGIDLLSLRDWMLSLPDGFVFWDSNGQEHCCAHAYFILKYRNTEATEPYEVRCDNKIDIDHFTWGLMDNNYRRIKWWKTSDKSITRVCGHYHKVMQEHSTIMLDDNCGYEDGRLALYDVEDKEIVYFDQQPATIEQTQEVYS